MKKILLLSLLYTTQSYAADKLSVMLDWFVNPDQAPLIIAQQKGYFTEQNLEVDIIEPSDTSIAPKMAAAEKVDLAFDSQPQLTVQLSEGLPLIKVSSIIDSPLNNLLARKDSGIKTLSDFKNKTIGYSVAGYDSVILAAMLKNAGLNLDDVKTVNINWAITQSLKSQQTDGVIGAYRIFENIELAQSGIEPIAFYPEQHGIPHYEEMILVANKNKSNDPRFKRFNLALEKAVKYIKEHPEDAWNSFINYKSGLDDALNKASWQATIPLFANNPAKHDPAQYKKFSQFLKDNGLTKTLIDVPYYQP